MALHTLSARQVQVAPVGTHADGGGLFLTVVERGASWVYRYTAPDGRRRELGCGRAERDTLAAAGASIASARKAAARARDQIAAGVDPIEARRAVREAAQAKIVASKQSAQAERATLARVARQYHEQTVEPRRTVKHSAQWIASLEQGVPVHLWHAPIDSIEPAPLLEALAALQARVPETASRVRQRLEAVFDDAIFHKLCTENPARTIRRKLAERPRGKAKGSFTALRFAEVPAFVKALRQQPGIAARALEFALLTAARTGEVLGATWAEIDAQAGVWRVPAARMKAGPKGGDHVVHLSPRAIEIVERMREVQGEPWLFPSPADRTKMLSNMAMLTLLKRMGVASSTTVHGVCRQSFSTWANETAAARPDVIEAALAHSEADKTRSAYNKASFSAERAALLRAWAEFCDGKLPQATVERPSASVYALPMPVAA